MGGDDFIVLLPDQLRDEDAVPVAERLMASITGPNCHRSMEVLYKFPLFELHRPRHVNSCAGFTVGAKTGYWLR